MATLGQRAPALARRVRRHFEDKAVVRRAGDQADDEGNAVGVDEVKRTVHGHWGLPAAEDLAIAGQMGQRLDAIYSFPPDGDIRTGDVVDINGRGRWKVRHVRPGRIQAKAALEQVDGP